MAIRTEIAGIAGYLPPDTWTSADVEARLRAESGGAAILSGMVESATGVRTRRFAAASVNCSDLAAEAARTALDRANVGPDEVDLLIFAAACQDLTEPATSNIVQEKVGTSCPVFDVKNACNSFLNAIQVADAMIKAGMHHTVLIACGETPSRGINWGPRNRRELKQSFMGYTFGDAGAAAVLRPATTGGGIIYQAFQTISHHWDIATIPGGGSMHPRGDEFTTFRGDGGRLKDAFVAAGPPVLTEALRAAGTCIEDLQRVLVHQVSVRACELFVRETGVPAAKVEMTVQEFGNLASASLPVAYDRAMARGDIPPGGLVAWVGMAAGISISVMIMRA